MALLPPKNIQRRNFQEHVIPAGSVLHRFFTKEHAGITFDPLYFDRGTGGRFNDSAHTFGVMYVSMNIEGAFAETFLRKKPGSNIRPELLDQKGYATFSTLEDLRLAKLFGTGLNKAGVTAADLVTRPPYDVTQAWAHELQKHKASFDGIAYHSRHNDEEICYALFDHVEPNLTEASRELDIKLPWFFKLVRNHGAAVYIRR